MGNLTSGVPPLGRADTPDIGRLEHIKTSHRKTHINTQTLHRETQRETQKHYEGRTRVYGEGSWKTMLAIYAYFRTNKRRRSK